MVFARKFRRHEPAIVLRIFKVNKFDSGIRRKNLVKFTTKIVAAKLTQHKLHKNFKIMKFLFWVQTNESFKEFIGKDIIILIKSTYLSSFAIFSKIGIAQTAQMKCRRDLNSSTLVKSSHNQSLNSKLSLTQESKLYVGNIL